MERAEVLNLIENILKKAIRVIAVSRKRSVQACRNFLFSKYGDSLHSENAIGVLWKGGVLSISSSCELSRSLPSLWFVGASCQLYGTQLSPPLGCVSLITE